MKHLFISVAAVALLVACGGDKDAETTDGTVKITEATKVAAKHPTLSSLSSFTAREGDASKTGDVLAALNLDTSGSGMAAFGSSDVDGDGATFSDVVIGDPESSDAVKIGKVELDGLDMTANGAVFSKLSFSDVEVADGDEVAKLDSFTIVNPSPELAAFLTTAFSGEDPGEMPSIDKLSFDAVSFGDFTFSGGDDDDGGVFKIGNVDLQGMGNGVLEAAVLSGLTFNGMDNGDKLEGGVKEIALYGADYAFLEDIQALGDNPNEDEVMALVMSSMSDATNPPYDGMVAKDINFDGSGINFDLPLLDVIVQRDDQDRMTAAVMKPFTMKLSADADGGQGGAELAEGLSMLGYKDITLKAEGVTNYDPDADLVTYPSGSNYIELVDGAKISYSGKLGGFAEYSRLAANMQTEFGPDPDVLTKALGQLTLHNFSLEIDDASLVDRMFTLAASQSGEDPQQLRNQTVMMMGLAPMMAAQSGVDTELLTAAIGPVTEFIKEPGTLTFTLNPSSPLNIGEIEDPALLNIETLGFSASHK